MNRSRFGPALVAVGIFAAALSAQEPGAKAPRVRRSLADGLVRQVIEREGFTPPKLTKGLDIGAGEGPLVLLVRQADGRLVLQELLRGRGDHGPAAEKVVVADEPIEEEDVEVKGPVEKGRPASTPLAKLVIRRRGELLELGAKADAPIFRGQQVDAAALRPFLKRQFDAREGSVTQRQLYLEVGPETRMQDVLSAWAVGREVGFESPLLGGLGGPGGRRLPEQAEAEIKGLAERFGWPVRRVGIGGAQPLCDGEVVILLDGPTPFRVIEPLLFAFVRAGIWQIGFVGQRDAQTRFKVRTNLPFDQGLVK